MGFVVDVIEDVIDVVVDVVSHVVDAVTKVVKKVVDLLSNKWVLIAALAAFSIFIAGPAIAAAYSSATAAMATAEIASLSTLAQLSVGVSTFVSTLSASFSAMLNAIHFSTILSAHNIAMLVSDDYRVMMYGVYSQISEVSSALGFYPQFLALAIRNSRNLVLDVSTSLGMPYDLAQVQWLGTFNEYLHKFNEKASAYENNPGELFADMEEWIDKPSMDTKGAFMTRTLQTIDKTLEVVDVVVKDSIKIRDDIRQLAYDLPENIRKYVQPIADKITEDFDRFVAEIYDPYKKEIDFIIAGLYQVQDKARKDMSDVVRRLKKPGDYLLEIDYFPDWEREDQERIFDDVSTRQRRRDVGTFNELGKATTFELDKLVRALKIALPIPLGFPEEIEVPVRPATVKATPRKTWYVGDY